MTWEVDGTSSGLCTMAQFGISIVEPSACHRKEFPKLGC